MIKTLHDNRESGRFPLGWTRRDRVAIRLLVRGFDLHLELWFLVGLRVLLDDAFSPVSLVRELSVLPMIAVALLLDAIIYGMTGTTPGRWWMGQQIVTSGGEPLSFRQYLWRNGAVWVRGLGCAVFPLCLWTGFLLYRDLLVHGGAAYDRKKGYVVTGAASYRMASFLWIFAGMVLTTIGSMLIGMIFC